MLEKLYRDLFLYLCVLRTNHSKQASTTRQSNLRACCCTHSSHMDWMNFVQIVAVIFSLFSGKQTEGQELDCHPTVRVRRNTNLKASPGEQLHVNCPVMFCSDSPPTVTWLKMYESHRERVSNTDQIQTWWRPLRENSGIAVLWFTNISADDAGVYQCQTSTSRSHYINVTVTGQELDCDPTVRVRRNTNLKASPGEQLHVNCPVTFCSDCPPTVTWVKMYESHPERVNNNDQIQTWWRPLRENSGIAVLWFTNISADDAGVYQCYFSDYQGTNISSHYISVTVTDPVTEDHTMRPSENHSCPSGGATANLINTNSSTLSFYVDVARIVIFAVMTSVVLVLLGRRILSRRGKSRVLTIPPAGGSQTQEGAAESGPDDPDEDYENPVELT